MNPMTNELKPCPFCGGEPREPSNHGGGRIVICCSNCGAERYTYFSDAEVRRMWNTRSTRTPPSSCNKSEEKEFMPTYIEKQKLIEEVTDLQIKVQQLEKENGELKEQNRFQSVQLGKYLMLPHPKELMEQIQSLQSQLDKAIKALQKLNECPYGYTAPELIKKTLSSLSGEKKEECYCDELKTVKPCHVCMKEERTAEEALEWLFKNGLEAMYYSPTKEYILLERTRMCPVKDVATGSTPIDCIRSAMANEKKESK
jgi:Lar family restriction alleviation protein